jgi:hypothetical protein
MLTGRGYSNPQAIQQFPTWLFVLTGRLRERILRQPSYLTVYYLAVGVDRKVDWEWILKPSSYLAVYYLAVGVDRKVEWERILGPQSYLAVYYLAVGVDRKV